MSDDSIGSRVASGGLTALCVIGAMVLLGIDILWLLDERAPVPLRHLVEWQVAPFLALGLMYLGARAGRGGGR